MFPSSSRLKNVVLRLKRYFSSLKLLQVTHTYSSKLKKSVSRVGIRSRVKKGVAGPLGTGDVWASQGIGLGGPGGALDP